MRTALALALAMVGSPVHALGPEPGQSAARALVSDRADADQATPQAGGAPSSARLLSCSAAGASGPAAVSGDTEIILQCSLSAPESGSLLVVANTALGWHDAAYTAHLGIGVDAPEPDPAVDRWVSVEAPEESGRSVPLSLFRPVPAGEHTVFLLARCVDGEGTPSFLAPVLSAVYVPAATGSVAMHGAASNMTWTSATSAFTTVREVSFTAPESGWVIPQSDGLLTLSDLPYEAHLAFSLDGMAADPAVDRWADVYDGTPGCAGEPFALVSAIPVSEGEHTIRLLARRHSGDGTIRLCDPTLSLLYVPSPCPAAVLNAAIGNLTWSSSADGWQEVRSSAMVGSDGRWSLVLANASVALADEPYTVALALAVDGLDPLGDTERTVHVWEDSGDGSDRSVSLAAMLPLPPGKHTIHLLARRLAGEGTVRLYDPSLVVVQPGIEGFLPFMAR